MLDKLNGMQTATIFIFFFTAFLCIPSSPFLYAHSGGVDANGGHFNRKKGEYHYHSGNKKTSISITSKSSSSNKESTRQTKAWVVGEGSLRVGNIADNPPTQLGTAYKANVIGVSDGDTIKVFRNGQQIKIRLYGIDTPEKKQAYGKAAKRFTANLVADKEVGIEEAGKDRYGRYIAIIDIDGAILNEELVRNGYAWVYDRYCTRPFCADWKKLEATARDKGAGLWADRDPQAPWEWRRDKRKRTQK